MCSAYLGLHDNDRRLADHFGGKLHLGFIEIREKLEKLRVSGALELENRTTLAAKHTQLYFMIFIFVSYRKPL